MYKECKTCGGYHLGKNCPECENDKCEFSTNGKCHCYGWASQEDLNDCNGTTEEQKKCAEHSGYAQR